MRRYLHRYEKLNLAPYSGFVNPVMIPVVDAQGKITDVKIEYCSDFLGQMMEYGKKYSFSESVYTPAINNIFCSTVCFFLFCRAR